MENIDDEADLYGIDFVKNDDPHAARNTLILIDSGSIVLLYLF